MRWPAGDPWVMFMDLDEFVYYPDKRPGRLSHWIDRVATHPMVGQVLIDRFNFGLQRSNTASTANDVNDIANDANTVNDVNIVVCGM